MMSERLGGDTPWAGEAVGELRRDEPMARHTTWRVGGPADWFYRPRDMTALAAFLQHLPADVPVTWVGLGSNLLVRDGGIRGVVISPRPGLTGWQAGEDGRWLTVEAGVACARIARHCGRAGVGPAAFFAGIPGTLGGALAMNAGAWGNETWEVVRRVQVLDRRGRLHRRDPEAYDVAYRHVRPRTPSAAQEWFVGAELAFAPLAQGEDVRALLVRRRQTQPLGQASCGSVFRNPQGDHAARLIEACGLKGRRRGGAVVSAQHANFIVNEGGARAGDIEELMREVAATVALRTGVELQPEVQVIGEATR